MDRLLNVVNGMATVKHPKAGSTTMSRPLTPDIDTSIFIDHLRTGRHQQRIAATTGLVRNSHGPR